MNEEKNGSIRVSAQQVRSGWASLAAYLSQREDDFFEQAMHVHGYDMREDTERQCDEECESCQ